MESRSLPSKVYRRTLQTLIWPGTFATAWAADSSVNLWQPDTACLAYFAHRFKQLPHISSSRHSSFTQFHSLSNALLTRLLLWVTIERESTFMWSLYLVLCCRTLCDRLRISPEHDPSDTIRWRLSSSRNFLLEGIHSRLGFRWTSALK